MKEAKLFYVIYVYILQSRKLYPNSLGWRFNIMAKYIVSIIVQFYSKNTGVHENNIALKNGMGLDVFVLK